MLTMVYSFSKAILVFQETKVPSNEGIGRDLIYIIVLFTNINERIET